MKLSIPTLAVLAASALPLFAQQPDLGNLITMPEAGAGVAPLQQGEEYTKTQAQLKAESKKAFSVSASLREEYDDNIYTAHDNKVSDYKTTVEPSFLFNYPMADTLLSARYTFDATAYADRDKTFDFGHDLVLRANHTFSSRFSLDARDRVHYAQEPEISTGSVVNRVAGTYFNNTFSLQGTTTWTPKLSTVSSYTNDYYSYDDKTVANTNNRDAHTLQNDFRYTLTPTVTLVNGGSISIQDYEYKTVSTTTGLPVSRSWNSYTIYTGADWTVLPEVTVGARGGGVYTVYDASGLNSSFAPYATAFVTWQTGARSSLDFSYLHSVAPTDVSSYSSATTDSFSLAGSYKFTAKLTGRLQGSYSLNKSDGDTSINAGASSYYENTLGLTAGLGYDLTQYLNLNAGYTLTNVGATSIGSSYNRNQISIGLTGSF
ncbi:Putative beta-barrel porin 2 [Verrucomicrobium sp. GAS474]|uniref:outer membrane beta-barrel protein n=1 Tax=Verrucomicrobium sp. GAS474 TaxID=1882831 RepID=UPI00087CA9D7|nr:outer membrane beta-barrel protein [Verrucomicrobium sp. GAS474]SDU21812.1 Putative beta-barrel porin 2 [Verrucomicrobium sp. GAS474]